jgi:hypothetical protein
VTQLTWTVDPKAFFREELVKASRKQNLPLEHHVEGYLVDLLCFFTGGSTIEVNHEPIDLLATPAAFLYQKAFEAPPEEKIKLFKALGDTTLYLSGYFPDSFNQKAFSLDYFINLGEKAYLQASSLSLSSRSTFHHLAKNFKDLVELLAYVGDHLNPKTQKDILALYSRWMTNPTSSRLRKQLEDSGILPLPNLQKTPLQ